LEPIRESLIGNPRPFPDLARTIRSAVGDLYLYFPLPVVSDVHLAKKHLIVRRQREINALTVQLLLGERACEPLLVVCHKNPLLKI
jgi:hypothetical protein